MTNSPQSCSAESCDEIARKLEARAQKFLGEMNGVVADSNEAGYQVIPADVVGGYWKEDADLDMRAAAALMPAPAQPAPVAWRYQRKEGWGDIWRSTTVPVSFETPNDWTIQPLYASQPSPVETVLEQSEKLDGTVVQTVRAPDGVEYQRQIGLTMLELLIQAGYDASLPHPDCFKGFSYLKLADILKVPLTNSDQRSSADSEPAGYQFRQRSGVGKGPQSSAPWCDWCAIDRETYEKYQREPNKLVQVRPVFANEPQTAPELPPAKEIEALISDFTEPDWDTKTAFASHRRSWVVQCLRSALAVSRPHRECGK